MIVHDLPGRLRLRGGVARDRALLQQSIGVRQVTGVQQAHYSPAACSVLVLYDPAVIARADLLIAIREAQIGGWRKEADTALSDTGPDSGQGNHDVRQKPTMFRLLRPFLLRPLIPVGLRPLLHLRHAWPRLRKGIAAVWRGGLTIDVLDAAAMAVCLVRRDYRTLVTINLLLGLGDFLENWTRSRSEQSLLQSLARQAVKARLRQGDRETEVEATALRVGDMVVVRKGSLVPVDGVVTEGEGFVDQSLITGEARLTDKRPGTAVFAGTLLEDGELLIRATENGDATIWRRTMLLLRDAEERKAVIHGQAERLASRLAPLTLIIAALVLLISRDPRRAASVLLVDYSCAIKLATPLAILSAMRQAVSIGGAVRGGRHLEDLAGADVFVFDKTGTLTMASPSVREIVPCNGWNRTEVLRLAACLEEHFPHPVAKAVVRQADAEGLEHAERHAMVEYVTAHGVASAFDGSRVLLGSRHFVEDDEGIDVSALAPQLDRWNDEGHTILFLAMGGELLAGFALEDPPRPEAPQVVAMLRRMGVRRIIMLTGDLDGMAERTCAGLGIDEWVAQALPEDKFHYIKKLKENGHVVAMVGDGLNDAAALAEASVGCCMRRGADMAREVADIVLSESELMALPQLRLLAQATLTRVKSNFVFIVGANSLLLAGGLLGLTAPALGAFLHNASTVAVALNALRPYSISLSQIEEQGGPS